VSPSFSPGDILTSRDEQSGRYQVSKILHMDDSVVVARLYVNRFDTPPTEVPEGLRLGITTEELASGEIGIGWGAIAFDPEGFASEEYIVIGTEPVTDEERENVEDALHPDYGELREGLMSRLAGLFRRRGS
jgi:hypothetical protein